MTRTQKSRVILGLSVIFVTSLIAIVVLATKERKGGSDIRIENKTKSLIIESFTEWEGNNKQSNPERKIYKVVHRFLSIARF